MSNSTRLLLALLVVSCLPLCAESTGDPCTGAEPGLEAARAAFDEGRLSDVETVLKPLGTSHPDCSGYVLELARLRAAQGKAGEAEDLFSRALTLAPDDAEAHALFARLQLSRGLRPQAVHLVARSLAIDPQCTEALVVRAKILTQRGLMGEARAVLERAVNLDPSSFEAHYELGVWFFRIGLYEQAARHFESATSLRRQSARSFDYLGFSLEKLGEGERAERAYREAVKLNSGPFFDPTLYYNFGCFLFKQGRLDESLTYIDKAASLFPDRRGPRYQRAKIHLAQGNLEKAGQDAERALALGKPDDLVSDLQVLYLLATIHSRAGETELAETYAQRAREAEDRDRTRDRQR